jgi:molybdopterin synthase catalytic subunit
MRVRVLLFGPAKDLGGVTEDVMELRAGATVGDVRQMLAQRYGRLAPGLPSMRLAVNASFAPDSTAVRDGDEVAVIPPVSGGGDGDLLVELVRGPIPVDRVRAFVVGDPALGGVVTFEGATREESNPEHGPLLRLEYEAYESMAAAELSRLAERARDRWGAGRVAVVHRLGPVLPGEASVMIAVGCRHRAEAFEACRWLIDMLKKEVPIWKQDVFVDGHVRWVEGSFDDRPTMAE